MSQKSETALALIAAGFVLAGCGGIHTMPRFVGGDPLVLPAIVSEGAGIRYASAEVSPQALRRHMEVRASDLIWPVNPLNVEAQNRRDEVSREMEHELQQDVSMEVLEELKACARTGRTLDAVVKIEDIVYGGYASPGSGADEMFATVELFEPGAATPIGRYPVNASSPRRFSMEGERADNGVSISINDREDSMAEWLGREICREVFGSEVRPSRWRNLTT